MATYKDDFFATPAHATEALVRSCEFIGSIWEPCCGDGSLSRVLENHFPGRVQSSDLRDRGFGTAGVNFLEAKVTVDNIISNPPYSNKEKFVRQGLRLARRRVAMLLPLDFLAGVRRLEFFPNLASVLVFVKRVQFVPGKSNWFNSAWFVWDCMHAPSGPPTIRWII